MLNRRNFLKVAAVVPVTIGVASDAVAEYGYIPTAIPGWGQSQTLTVTMEQAAAVMNAMFYHGSATLRRSQSDMDDWDVTLEFPC